MVAIQFDDMDLYEQGVVQGLQDRGYTIQNATKIVNEYRAVIEHFEDYVSPCERARQLVNGIEKGFTPEKWLAYINKLQCNVIPEKLVTERERKLIEENHQLKKMLEQVLQKEKKCRSVLSKLNLNMDKEESNG
ncbi:hypothetical protein AM501_24115 [Aneurinibacillus migulanus]|uniref:hypothetical protein n=1 Tax=Aneurinibacillus migulanus TaxID=47500 RepID=UPI0005BDB4B8|nr:hypothetical protein [Aneurinibacillus migulanus]KIV58907.1 hypothetical protein TS64_03865 [Aneurinibacillus migulanus]KPD05861.1 hypothetical protein AM501_24115 [Aneurinibacillus migulanus]